jgi:IrrE N-terminal-like domain
MKEYDPWHALADLRQARVVFDDLPPRRRGEVDFGTQTITLHRRLDPTAQRCTLAHELVHLERGPVIMWHAPREERTVAAIAARRLVGIDDLAEAMRWSQDERSLAEELSVDVRTVRVRLHSLDPTERAFLRDRVGPDADP